MAIQYKVYDLRDMLINMGDDEFVLFEEKQSGNTYDRVKEKYSNETKAFTELYHTFKDRLEDYHGEVVYAKGGSIKDMSFAELYDYLRDKDEGDWDNVNSEEIVRMYIDDMNNDGINVSHIEEVLENNPSREELYEIWLGNSMNTPIPINTKEDLLEALELDKKDYAKGGLVIEEVRFGKESEDLEDYLDNNSWEVIEKEFRDKGTKFTLSMKDVEYEQRVDLEDYLDNKDLKYKDNSFAKGGLIDNTIHPYLLQQKVGKQLKTIKGLTEDEDRKISDEMLKKNNQQVSGNINYSISKDPNYYAKGGVTEKDQQAIIQEGSVIEYVDRVGGDMAEIGYRDFYGTSMYYIMFNAKMVHSSKTYKSMLRKLNQLKEDYNLEYRGVQYAKGGEISLDKNLKNYIDTLGKEDLISMRNELGSELDKGLLDKNKYKDELSYLNNRIGKYMYAKGGEIKRFDRHESMPDETRDEISYLLNGRSEDFHPYRIIDTGLRAAKKNEYWNEKQINELRNYLFGLYDGYNYSHTEDFKKVLSNLKKSNIKTGNRVEKLFNEVDKYPKAENSYEYAKGGKAPDDYTGGSRVLGYVAVLRDMKSSYYKDMPKKGDILPFTKENCDRYDVCHSVTAWYKGRGNEYSLKDEMRGFYDGEVEYTGRYFAKGGKVFKAPKGWRKTKQDEGEKTYKHKDGREIIVSESWRGTPSFEVKWEVEKSYNWEDWKRKNFPMTKEGTKEMEEFLTNLMSSSYAKGGEIYEVEYWETEEDRDMGEGNMYMLSEEEEESKEKSIQRAKNLFSKQNFASVEVLDEDGSVVFHISNDEPKGESYAKGGKTDDVIMIKIGGDKKYPYYIKKIDTTHMSMANNKDGVDLVVPSHILQHKGESYYDDVRSWLKGGQSPNGKSYDSDYYAKGGNLERKYYTYDIVGDKVHIYQQNKEDENSFDSIEQIITQLKKEGHKEKDFVVLKKDGRFAKGGEVKKKENNEMIMGGLAGILLGIFLNK